MNLKIKKRDIIYIVLIFAILSGTLRITDNGMTSLYRLIGPFVVGTYLISNFKKLKKETYFFICLLIYSFIISIVFYNHIAFDQIVFVIYIFFEYILIKTIKIKDNNFENHFFKFIDICSVITIIAAWGQYFIGYTLPHIEISRGQPIGVYFSNGNELSEALCCVLVIYVYQIMFCKKKGYIFHCVCILSLTYLNDAKLSLIGAIVAIFIIAVYKFCQRGNKVHLGDKSFLIIVIIIVFGLIGILYILNPTIETRDYSISLHELIFDAIIAILKGRELNIIGSIHERSSAIIYGMQELRKSYFFGIGIGNSITMLAKPQYYLKYAMSMHNIIFQFLTECGYFAMVVYYFVIKYVVNCFKNITHNRINLLKGTFIISFVFISSQSSVGILSNYFTIMVLIYIALIDKKFDFKKNRV